MTGVAVDFVEEQRRRYCKPGPNGGWICPCGGELAGENDLICQACRDKFAAEREAQQRREWEHRIRSIGSSNFERLPSWEHIRTADAFAKAVTHPKLRGVAEQYHPRHGSIVLLSLTGEGKTSALARAVWRNREEAVAAVLAAPRDSEAEQRLYDACDVLWVKASELVRASKQHRLGSESQPELHSDAEKAHLLVIDELGPEHPAYGGEIFDLVDRRHDRGRITAVTSGLTKEMFEARYGAAFLRRLSEEGRGSLINVHPSGTNGQVHG